MLPYTALVVQQHLDQLRADAAEARLARTSRPARRPSRVSAKVRQLMPKMVIPADDMNCLPTLSDYPYRG
jgi:hypothetical protein